MDRPWAGWMEIGRVPVERGGSGSGKKKEGL